MLRQNAMQLPRTYRLRTHLLVACGVGLLLGIAATGLSPLLVLGGLLGVGFLALVTRRAEIGVLSLVFVTSGLIDSGRLPLLTMGSFSFHMTDLILLYLLALILGRGLVQRGFAFVRTPLDVPLILFGLAILASTILALSQPGADANWVFRRLRPLSYYMAFFAVTNLIRDRRQLTTLMYGLLVIAVLSSLATLLQVLLPSLGWTQVRSMELVTAGLTYAGITRAYLPGAWLVYLAFIISVCFLVTRRALAAPALGFAQAAILIVGLVLGFGRNVWLGLVVALALMLLLTSWPERFRLLRWAIVGIVVLALLLSLPGTSLDRYLTATWDRVVTGMQPDTLARDNSVQMRLMEIRNAVETIADHPLRGIGLGGTYRPAIPDDRFWMPENPALGLRWYIHDTYLWIWIDMGLVGLIPFVWLYVRFLARGFGRWRGVRDPFFRAWFLGSTLGILGLTLSNLVAPSFVEGWSLVIFGVVMGINEIILIQPGTRKTSDQQGGIQNARSANSVS
ncbi:MAG: O-antigen ligase family protein [Chloroflexi bacterium]|nr:O-antigen ligase family protein [Chloroflexota bacterium]